MKELKQEIYSGSSWHFWDAGAPTPTLVTSFFAFFCSSKIFYSGFHVSQDINIFIFKILPVINVYSDFFYWFFLESLEKIQRVAWDEL